ncbi:hypothetical protein [Chryseobacterium taihuense]|nr:hypothetical protein [Chryseobacterium taihuense]
MGFCSINAFNNSEIFTQIFILLSISDIFYLNKDLKAKMIRKVIFFFILLHSLALKSQTTMSGLDKGLAIGNILVQGFAALKGNNAKPVDPNAKTVDSFCFKNKMDEKITVKLNGKIEDEEIKKNSLSQKTKKNVRTTFQKVFILMKFCFQVRILIKKENIKFTKKL